MRFCRYHCSKCGCHFTSLEAFDAHKEGVEGTDRPCTFPDDGKLVELTGFCEHTAAGRLENVTIYEGVRSQRARARWKETREERITCEDVEVGDVVGRTRDAVRGGGQKVVEIKEGPKARRLRFDRGSIRPRRDTKLWRMR